MSDHPRLNLDQAVVDSMRGTQGCLHCHRANTGELKSWVKSGELPEIPIGDTLSLFLIGFAALLFMKGRKAWAGF